MASTDLEQLPVNRSVVMIVTIYAVIACASGFAKDQQNLEASLQALFALNWRNDAEISSGAQKLIPFDSITLNVVNGMSYLKPYRITLYRTGEAKFDRATEKGNFEHFKGKFSVLFYARLAQLVERVGFMSFDRTSAGSGSDDNQASISVTVRNRVKTVTEDLAMEGSGPAGLWALRTLIDYEQEHIQWIPIDEK